MHDGWYWETMWKYSVGWKFARWNPTAGFSQKQFCQIESSLRKTLWNDDDYVTDDVKMQNRAKHK